MSATRARFAMKSLKNGLQVAVEEMPSMKSVTVGVFVKTGSRDERDPVMGVSHFLEHMMFKGTDTLSTHDLNLAFDHMGAIVNNASTGQDATTYFAKVLPEYTQEALNLLMAMMKPALRTEDFTMEKNVILEEIALYLDRPQFDIMDRAMRGYFEGHPLSIPVLGTNESIKAMTAEEMRAYWAARYVPANMVVVATGAVSMDAFFPLVEAACGGWTGPSVQRTFPPLTPNARGLTVIPKSSFARQHVVFMSPSPAHVHPWIEPTTVLCTLLGDEEHSRLYWELVEPGLADAAELGEMPFEDCGAFTAYVSCEPSRAKEIVQKMLKVIRSPSGFTNEELELAKNKVMSDIILGAERGVGRYYAIGSDLLGGLPYRTVEEQAAAVERVTKKDLEKLLAAYPMKDWAITTLGPLEKLEV